MTQAAAAPGRFPLYHDFSRAQWAALRGSVPMTVLAHELAHFEGLSDVLSLDEVEEIYRPLGRLAGLHAAASRGSAADHRGFPRPAVHRVPYVIGIAGSVAVGKSTIARLPQTLLAREGVSDILVSDFLDFSIYVDADQRHIRQWYVDRFLALRLTAFRDPASFFHRYSRLTDDEAARTAGQIWDGINYPNLVQNILPTRSRARLVLEKGADHLVRGVRLRRI